MKKLVFACFLFAAQASCQVTVSNKSGFVLDGKKYITPQMTIEKGVQRIVLDFHEMDLPVSNLQKAQFATKADNSAFGIYQKTLSDQMSSRDKTIQILLDSVISMSKQIAALKYINPPLQSSQANANYDSEIASLRTSLLNKVNLSDYNIFIGTLKTLKAQFDTTKTVELYNFSTAQENGIIKISNAPIPVTVAQRLSMTATSKPGTRVYQIDGKQPGEYRLSGAINDWAFEGL